MAREEQDGALRTAYGVGAMLVVLPALEVGLSSVPLKLASAEWRFVVASITGNALPLPLLGAALIVFAAVGLGDRRVSRAVGVALALTAFALVVMTVVFAADAAYTRAHVRAGRELLFERALAKVAASFAFGIVLCGWLAAVALRGARSVGDHGLKMRGRAQRLGAGLPPAAPARPASG